MGPLYLEYLDADIVYSCNKCGTHLSEINEIISKAFTAHTGKAYLFGKV